MNIQPSFRFPLLALTAAALGLPMAAHAVPPLDQVGTLATTCSGALTGGGMPAGINHAAMFRADKVVCREAFDPLLGLVKVKKAFQGDTGGSGLGGAAALPGGKLQVSASNNAIDSEGGSAIAGFTDRLLIESPGLTGQGGFLYYKVKLKGTIQAHGSSGGARLSVFSSVPGFQEIPTTWAANSDFVNFDVTLNVDETAVIRQLFNFGVPFHLSTIAHALAGVRSLGGESHGSVSFTGPNAIRLKGIDRVTNVSEVPVPYTFTAQSNLPWNP